jgi:hypothetical protein
MQMSFVEANIKLFRLFDHTANFGLRDMRFIDLAKDASVSVPSTLRMDHSSSPQVPEIKPKPAKKSIVPDLESASQKFAASPQQQVLSRKSSVPSPLSSPVPSPVPVSIPTPPAPVRVRALAPKKAPIQLQVPAAAMPMPKVKKEKGIEKEKESAQESVEDVSAFLSIICKLINEILCSIKRNSLISK